MTDLLTATQNAIYDALNVPAVTALAPVYEHVPDDQQPPIVIIGDITAEPDGGKSSTLERVTVEILTVRREPAREALYELMDKVRTALEGVALSAAGAVLSPATFEASDDDLSDDGNTYIGTQRFFLYAQPA